MNADKYISLRKRQWEKRYFLEITNKTMNNLTIATILNVIILITVIGVNYTQNQEIDELTTKIVTLEDNQPDTAKNTEDKALIVDAVLETSERLDKAIEIYDENVQIYNKKIKQIEADIKRIDADLDIVFNYLKR